MIGKPRILSLFHNSLNRFNKNDLALMYDPLCMDEVAEGYDQIIDIEPGRTR